METALEKKWEVYALKYAERSDRTKASYWSCRLPRYAKLLGFKTTFSGFW